MTEDCRLRQDGQKSEDGREESTAEGEHSVETDIFVRVYTKVPKERFRTDLFIYPRLSKASSAMVSLVTVLLPSRWILKLFVDGYKRELDESDLYSPLEEDRSNYLGQRIVKNWEEEAKRCEKRKDGSKPSLYRVLYKCFGGLVMYTGLWTFFLEFVIRYSSI